MKTKLIILCFIVSLPIQLLVAQVKVDIYGPESLVRVGMNPHPSQKADSTIAVLLHNALTNYDRDSLKTALSYYKRMAENNKLKEKSYGSISYILARYLGEKQNRVSSYQKALNDDLFEYFSSNNFERLKKYLVIKYELFGYKPASIKEFITERTFCDDLLMFNNPSRDSWDCTHQIMKDIPVSEGSKVIDMGCGLGFNSVRIAEIVGKNGLVYSTDTDSSYINHIKRMVDKNGIKNILPIAVTDSNIGVKDSVDIVFVSSLYHIIYTWSREDQRMPLLKSITECLKKNGRLVIIDNNNLHGEELNNCHVSPHLIEAQLYYYGFEKVSLKNLSKQRYLLIMKYNGVPKKPKSQRTNNQIEISNGKSIIHIGSLDSYDITEQGTDAARYVYEFISGGRPELAYIAIQKYKDLIPSENFGGEYSALQWICEVKISNTIAQRQMLADPLSRSFYNTMTDDSCKILRYYLMHKYKLEPEDKLMLSDSLLEKTGEVGRTHRSYLEDYILALNPNRPKWENTEVIINNCELKEGDTIVDIGCGSGFFTYRFSNITGIKGKVYAVETKDEHIQKLEEFLQQEHITNVEVIKGREDSLNIPMATDKMFMCSLYHIMYGVISDSERDKYLKSLISHLKINGKLIIVDNGPVDDDNLPYHGPFISKELIIKQLAFYGLALEKNVQIIPQRYMLVFKKIK